MKKAEDVEEIAEILGTSPLSHDSEYLKALLDNIRSLPKHRTYSHMESLLSTIRSLADQGGREYQAQEYLGRILLSSLMDPEFWTPDCRVPETLRALMDQERQRIRRNLETQPPGFYTPGKDSFLKDINLLLGKLLPLEAGVADIGTRLWRRPLRTGNFSQRVAFCTLAARPPFGLGPMFQVHTHTDMLSNFSEAGWQRAYFHLADLLNLNPHFKGWTRASWFCDPALKHVSPRLSYISEIPVSGGAYLFYLGQDQSGDAFVKSATRRSLREQGKYTPKRYMLAWHRDDAIPWAKKHRAP